MNMREEKTPRCPGCVSPIGGALVLFIFFSLVFIQAESTEHLRTYRDGDVVLGMLLPMHTASTDDGNCSTVSIKSIFVLEAMLYAMMKINYGMRGTFRFGYDVRDTCFSVSTAMKQGLNFVANIEDWTIKHEKALRDSGATGKAYTGFPFGAKYDQLKNSTLCKEKPIMGIIGASGSSVSIAVAGLMSLYKIPMISYFSTSTALSDTYNYPSFFRTIPSDDKQTIAMAELITRFRWNYISTIATDNEYGREGIEALKGEISFRNICLARDDLYDPTAGTRQVVNIIKALKDDARVKVVILFMYWQHAKLFLNEAYNQNLTGVTWIASESWSSTSELLKFPPSLAKGIIGISVPSQYYPDFKANVLRSKLTKRVKANPWLSVYMKEQAKFNCNLAEPASNCSQTVDDPNLKPCNPNLTLNDLLESYETLSVTVNAANAFLAFERTMKMIMQDEKNDLKKRQWINHKDLLKYMNSLNFTGAGKSKVRFDKNGDFVGARYHILNVQYKDGRLQHVKIGEWNMENSHGKLVINESMIQWNSGQKPVSRCSAVCQPGTYMIPSPSECCWDCQKCAPMKVSNTTQAPACFKCDLFYHTNDEQSKCIPNAEMWARQDLVLAIAALFFGSFSHLCVIAVFVTIVVFRNLALVCKTELKYTFLAVCFVGLVYPYLHMVRPEIKVCSFQAFILMIPLSLQPVILLCQTEPVIFLSGEILLKVFRRNSTKRFAQLFTFSVLGIFGVALCFSSLAAGFPGVTKTLVGTNQTFLGCDDPYDELGVLSVVFVFLLLMLGAICFEREKVATFHSNYNSISCYIMLLIAAVTVPVYALMSAQQPRITILTLATTIIHLTLLGLKFVPQMYDIFVKKDRTIQTQNATTDTDISHVSADVSPKSCARKPAQEEPEVEHPQDSIPMTDLHPQDKEVGADNIKLQVPEIIVDHDDRRSSSPAEECLDVVRDSKENSCEGDLHIKSKGEEPPQSPTEGPVQVLNSFDGKIHTTDVVFV